MSIFETLVGPTARESDPPTSHDAADHHDGLSAQRRMVLAALADKGHATAYELLCHLATYRPIVPQQSVIARRLTDLHELGLVEDTGTTRPGSSKRRLIVWRITNDGREALA